MKASVKAYRSRRAPGQIVKMATGGEHPHTKRGLRQDAEHGIKQKNDRRFCHKRLDASNSDGYALQVGHSYGV